MDALIGIVADARAIEEDPRERVSSPERRWAEVVGMERVMEQDSFAAKEVRPEQLLDVMEAEPEVRVSLGCVDVKREADAGGRVPGEERGGE